MLERLLTRVLVAHKILAHSLGKRHIYLLFVHNWNFFGFANLLPIRHCPDVASHGSGTSANAPSARTAAVVGRKSRLMDTCASFLAALSEVVGHVHAASPPMIAPLREKTAANLYFLSRWNLRSN
jgi:hypothetical protein